MKLPWVTKRMVVISLLTISGQIKTIPAIRDCSGEELRRGLTDASLAKLVIQGLTLVLQLALFGKLIALARRFGRDQNEAAQDTGSPS